MELDLTDLQLLAQLQVDASLSNQALAERVHTSPPTCLRRVKRLHDAGLIERQVAILNPQRMAEVIGHGLTAIVEITLDRQDSKTIVLTHELMANLLGVRREGVTQAAHRLMNENILQYSRGNITVLDRKALEDRTCECYSVISREYDNFTNMPC